MKTLEQYQEMFNMKAVNSELLYLVDYEIHIIEQYYKFLGYDIGQAILYTNHFNIEAWQYLGIIKCEILNTMNGERR